MSRNPIASRCLPLRTRKNQLAPMVNIGLGRRELGCGVMTRTAATTRRIAREWPGPVRLDRRGSQSAFRCLTGRQTGRQTGRKVGLDFHEHPELRRHSTASRHVNGIGRKREDTRSLVVLRHTTDEYCDYLLVTAGLLAVVVCSRPTACRRCSQQINSVFLDPRASKPRRAWAEYEAISIPSLEKRSRFQVCLGQLTLVLTPPEPRTAYGIRRPVFCRPSPPGTGHLVVRFCKPSICLSHSSPANGRPLRALE